jgi:hypothetical protein
MGRAISGGAIGLLLGGVLAAPAAAQQRVEIPTKEKVLQGTPAQVYSIGTEEGRDWEMLARVTSVTFDRQDNLYVLDAGNYRVLVFDRNGSFVRQIGKQGSGPGEITFAMAMAILPDGNIALSDAGRSGFSIFAPDGTYVKNVSSASGMRGAIGNTALAASPQGGVITQVRPSLRPEAGAIDPKELAKSQIVRTPLEDNPKPVTLYEIVTEAPKVQQQGSSGRIAVMIRAQTFAPQPSWGVLPTGGVAVLNGLDYRIAMTDAAGKVVRTLEKSEKPRAVSRRDQDNARDAMRARLKNGGGGGIQVRNNNGQTSYSFGGGGGSLSDDQINERIRDMEFAETMPVVQRIRTDPKGRIWVQRTPDVGSDGGPIDLLTETGSIGTLRNAKLPDAVSASGLAAYIETDDLDVQHVVVRRLPATWR